jgi:5'-methylthioadenosine phosphorylase
MTAVTEAKLSREAELCFAALALVTDLDAWHADEAAVTASAVVEVLRANVAGARQIVARLPAEIPARAGCGCARAAAGAVLTSLEVMGVEARERLRKLLGRETP